MSAPGAIPGDPPGGRRALVVWGTGVAVYFVAIVFRTSLGVAGLDAADRFDVNASALSTFSILQLLVYAGMQIPVGLLVDRLGTRKVLTLGALLFTAGQLGFALAPTYGMALAARALLGCGDAMTFISVLRLGSRWFPARRGPLIAQVAALFGMAGNLVSTVVVARLLHDVGWTATFAGSAVAGAVAVLLVLLLLKDHPEGQGPPPATGHRGASFVRRQVALSWREPGTRLGMWVHFTTQFPAMVFLLLWGMPFLIEAQGLSRETAGSLLTLVVLASMVVGLVYGQIIARHHAARVPLALGTVGATALVWAATLAHPGDRAPMWLLIVLCAVLGAGGPASMIGFDFARPANPPERQGTASGIVNVGGFTASMTTLLVIGVLLDATGGDYRTAFSCVFVLEALGVVQILRLRGRAARLERERLVASRVEAVHVPA
ncbi:MFS transporter [Streptomyces clavuligerus]|uniref:Transmembrane transport protein n=1 Tax=Streptomyces clavuligerus TaxID=1901 RepID=B5GU71_STRCL|nr:MFS transporter [Streptomyces clavuligerus]ANW19176.1 MFS transporter [Streptomyces clavuligerus]AXU13771.1 MFS transporter [Streptomyces clavuligerus]EDY49867.1 transmembrane transport protein [Streptomyces clavuligerus]EFG08073.1 Transmembrane transport protein [Streptomyces clavuligerus]MBY6303736.1 MFS transporter [Streptomyces clavuligerus]